MKKYILGIAALLIAITVFFAFKTKEAKAPEVKKEAAPEVKPLLTPTWYQYKTTAPQTPLARKDKSNYVRQASQPSCSSGTINECSILLADDFGSTPTTANITFDGTTGMPVAGVGDVTTNHTKGL